MVTGLSMANWTLCCCRGWSEEAPPEVSQNKTHPRDVWEWLYLYRCLFCPEVRPALDHDDRDLALAEAVQRRLPWPVELGGILPNPIRFVLWPRSWQLNLPEGIQRAISVNAQLLRLQKDPIMMGLFSKWVLVLIILLFYKTHSMGEHKSHNFIHKQRRARFRETLWISHPSLCSRVNDMFTEVAILVAPEILQDVFIQVGSYFLDSRFSKRQFRASR